MLRKSTKWKDIGGGRGYGNVTSKVTKYICNGVSDTRKLPNISGASIQGGEVRNNVAGGLEGNTINQEGIILCSNLESDSSEMDEMGAKGDV